MTVWEHVRFFFFLNILEAHIFIFLGTLNFETFNIADILVKGESLLSCDATEYSSGTKLQISDQRKALNKVIFYLENGNEVYTYLKNTVA